MGSEANEIMAPDVEVSLRGGQEKVVVREMNWKAAQTFLRTLAAQIGFFMSFDETGQPVVDQMKLIGVATGALSVDLVCGATGKDVAWVEALSFTDYCRVLEEAIAVNLRPEMFEGPKKVFGRLKTLLPQTTFGTSATPTISSAASAATPASTSTPAPGGSSTS